ncbi:Uncharacterised protein [Vibrio cholerae]|nr:Uncharacterised protein [Vibrio cholerae]CSI61962.1 Uncharacterised protein [Vibrio cholerae]
MLAQALLRKVRMMPHYLPNEQIVMLMNQNKPLPKLSTVSMDW